jgi:hypothetical protein
VVSLGIVSLAIDVTMCPGVDSVSKNEYQECPVFVSTTTDIGHSSVFEYHQTLDTSKWDRCRTTLKIEPRDINIHHAIEDGEVATTSQQFVPHE